MKPTYYIKKDDLFFNAYIECALWSSNDHDDEPLDRNYSIDDIAPESLSKLKTEAIQFFNDNIELINENESYSYDQAGHDLWLTRNGHGAGYWDRGLGDIGDKLTTKAESLDQIDLYIGDDGLIYY